MAAAMSGAFGRFAIPSNAEAAVINNTLSRSHMDEVSPEQRASIRASVRRASTSADHRGAIPAGTWVLERAVTTLVDMPRPTLVGLPSQFDPATVAASQAPTAQIEQAKPAA